MFLLRFLCTLLFICSFSAPTLAAEATFSWLPNSETNLTGYNIYYGTSSRNYTDVIDAGLPTPVNGRIQTTVNNLEEGTTYYFAATAYDSNGNESGYSDEINHTVENGIVTPQPDGQADFSWLQNTEPNLSGYKIYYGTASRTYTSNLDIGLLTPVNGRIHGTVTGLTTGTTYYFAATAYNSEGNESDYSDEIVYTVAAAGSTTPPTAADSAVTGYEDSPINGTLTISNPSALPLQYTITTNSIHGTITVEDATGQFTYNPLPDFNGQDSFSFTATNDNGVSNTATVTITVNAVNDQPSAQNNNFSTNEDVALNGQLSATDIDGHALTYILISQTDNGTVVINSNGTFTYTPAANWNGTDTFSFAANDGTVNSNTATVSLTVHPTNDQPTAHNASFSTNEDAVVNGQLSASDADQDSLSYSLISQANNGIVAITNGTFTYTPNEDWNGTDTFSFAANDGSLNSNTATISITVHAINDLPAAHNANFDTSEDAAVNGQLSASDIDGDTLSYALVSQVNNGTVTVNANGTFTYTPAENWNGTDTFTFKANDSSADSNVATINITVNAVNDIPTAADQFVSVDAGFAYNGQLTAADQEGDSISFITVLSPSLGAVTINSDGSYTYTAQQDAEGADSFSFKVNDGNDDSNIATVSITITQQETSFRFELTEIQADSNWQSVIFESPFTNPVVIARTTSFNDSETGVVRVKNVTTTGLELRFQEWDSLDDQHPVETITILIAEKGSFTLDDGTMVEAGCFSTTGASDFSSLSFQQRMTVAPVVMAAINTVNEEDAVTTRIRNITINGFEIMMREQEANSTTHTEETGCYLAWEPSIGTLGNMQYEIAVTEDQITANSYTIHYRNQFIELPMILAAMQTTDGADTAVLRISNNSLEGMSVFVSEEQSIDSETAHNTERGGYVAIAAYNPLGDPDHDSLSTIDEENIYNTHPGLADTDNDGMDDGDEISYWLEQGSSWDSDIDNDGLNNLLDQDSDNDGMPDGSEVAAGFDPADATSHPAFPTMEGGEVDVDSNWVHVNFTSTFANPVVIARLVSKNDGDPCVVRMNNITGNGFDLRIQEYDYQDGYHMIEQVSYLVMEAGHYTLADGTQIEAGILSTSAASFYDNRSFNQNFTLTPVVITSITSFNEADTVTTRIRNINLNGFELKLQEQELNATSHMTESLAYIAWEPSCGDENGMYYEVGRSADTVTQKTSILDYTTTFSDLPLLYTDMQTTDGGDTASLRTVSNGVDSLQVTVEEEQSRNDEVAHTTEVAGFIAILAQ